MTVRFVAVLVAGLCTVLAASLAADTYRWKDNEGKTHYGSTVPAEYADQPYDILNNAGIVIEHVEDTSLPPEVIVEEPEDKGQQPLISEDARQQEFDKLLVIQYRSEQEIIKALDQEIAQVGYDSNLIKQSFKSTSTAIRDQIRMAADQQRSGKPITEDQQKEITNLYKRRARDERRQAALLKREVQIRSKFQSDLDRYRTLTSEPEETEAEPADQG